MDLLREELLFGMDNMTPIEEVLRNSEPNSVVYLSANEARALEEPDKIRARMERLMQGQEARASINTAADSVDPATIQNEMHRQHEHYGELLARTVDDIERLEQELEFKRDVKANLVGARDAIERFLWPEQVQSEGNSIR